MNRFFLLSGMILVAVLSKCVPHPINFTPIGAIALFAGAQFASKRAAYLVPLVALLISDFITGFHVLIPFVYGCFALNVLLGFWIRHQKSAHRTVSAVLIGAVVFFPLYVSLSSLVTKSIFTFVLVHQSVPNRRLSRDLKRHMGEYSLDYNRDIVDLTQGSAFPSISDAARSIEDPPGRLSNGC